MNDIEKKISRAATQIAGCIFEDAEGTVRQRLETAIKWRNMGTDGDLLHEDRLALELLLEYLDGGEADLMDYDTAEAVRTATLDEAIESAMASPTGAFDGADGRTYYVQL